MTDLPQLPDEWKWTVTGPDEFRAEGPDEMYVYATTKGGTGGSGTFHPKAMVACCEAAGQGEQTLGDLVETVDRAYLLAGVPTQDLVNELRKRDVLQQLKQMPESLDGVYVHVQERESEPKPEPMFDRCQHSESYARGARCSWCGEIQ